MSNFWGQFFYVLGGKKDFFSFWKSLKKLKKLVFLGLNFSYTVLYPLYSGYQNCSDILWEKIVLVTEKNFWNWGWRLRICKNFEITKTIYLNRARSDQFFLTNAFSTCSWRFLRSNLLEQFKLEKIIGIKKSAGKVRKSVLFRYLFFVVSGIGCWIRRAKPFLKTKQKPTQNLI